MGLSAGEFASASLCVDAGEGIKDAQVHMRGGGGPQIAPPSHPYILARAQYNASPSGQIFAGASIYIHTWSQFKIIVLRRSRCKDSL